MESELMSPKREQFLRYWSANMQVAFAQSSGAPWLGFGYQESEMARMRALAASLPRSAAAVFFAVTVMAYLLMAAVAIGAVMIPILTLLYPDPSQTPALVFVLTLAVAAFICLGFGLPLSMAIGARAGDWWSGAGPAPGARGDQALAAKICWQLWRITLIMVGVFVPGCMFFILLDIEAGPLVTAIKVLCGSAALLSLAKTVKGPKS